jgi:hypothetical protein
MPVENPVPVIVTRFPPLGLLPCGEIPVIVGAGSVYEKPAVIVALVPSGFVTVTSRLALPEKSNGPGGVVAVMELELTTFTLAAASVPIFTVAPLRKFVPEIVIVVPPAFDPLDGETEATEGPVGGYVYAPALAA